MTYALTVMIVLLSVAAIPAAANLFKEIDMLALAKHDANGWRLLGALLIAVAIGVSLFISGDVLSDLLGPHHL